MVEGGRADERQCPQVLPPTALAQPTPRGKSTWEPAAHGAGHLSCDCQSEQSNKYLEVYSTASLLLCGNTKGIGLGTAATVAGWLPEADGNHYNSVSE